MAENRTKTEDSEHTAVANTLQYVVEGVRDPVAARAIVLLSQGATYGEVADTLRIGRTKLWELRRQHNIDEHVAALAMDVVEASYRRNLAITREAVDTIIEIMRTGETEKIRMDAAEKLLAQQRQDARIAAYARARGHDLSGSSDDELAAIIDLGEGREG